MYIQYYDFPTTVIQVNKHNYAVNYSMLGACGRAAPMSIIKDYSSTNEYRGEDRVRPSIV